MKKSLRFAFAALALLLIGPSIQAQTVTENLQSAVEIYNALREYQDGLDPKTVDQSNLDDIKYRMDKGIVLLDQVLRDGNADQIKVARYFRNNFKYEYGFILGMMGNNAKAYEAMKEIEKDFTNFSAADFPLKYDYFGKAYIINWDNYAPTQAEFLTGMAEISYNLGKYGDAIRVNKKAIAHPNTTGWLRYIAVNKMIDIYNTNSSLLTQTEYLDYALQSIQEYDKMDEINLESVKENNYPTAKRGVGILVKSYTGIVTPEAATRFGSAAPIAAKSLPNDVEVLKLYELAYRGGYNGDATYHKSAEAYARNNKGLNAMVATYVGTTAIAKLAASTFSGNCEELLEIADLYGKWNMNKEKTEYNKKYDACMNARDKANAKAAKAARRNNGNFNLYLGADLIPLLNTNPKRDYGAVVDFVFKKSAIEFGYKKIRNNKENIFDLWINEVDDASQDNISRWDGFKLHFQPKFFNRHTHTSYFGIYLGYNEKNFDSLDVSVVHDLDGSYSVQTFKPGVTQYVGMLNFGSMLLGKGVGMDIHFGIGANYSTFDAGNPLDRSVYTIDNPLLEYRKDHYWGLVMHAGITMGLNFGPGNQ